MFSIIAVVRDPQIGFHSYLSHTVSKIFKGFIMVFFDSFVVVFIVMFWACFLAALIHWLQYRRVLIQWKNDLESYRYFIYSVCYRYFVYSILLVNNYNHINYPPNLFVWLGLPVQHAIDLSCWSLRVNVHSVFALLTPELFFTECVYALRHVFFSALIFVICPS